MDIILDNVCISIKIVGYIWLYLCLLKPLMSSTLMTSDEVGESGEFLSLLKEDKKL